MFAVSSPRWHADRKGNLDDLVYSRIDRESIIRKTQTHCMNSVDSKFHHADVWDYFRLNKVGSEIATHILLVGFAAVKRNVGANTHVTQTHTQSKTERKKKKKCKQIALCSFIKEVQRMPKAAWHYLQKGWEIERGRVKKKKSESTESAAGLPDCLSAFNAHAN